MCLAPLHADRFDKLLHTIPMDRVVNICIVIVCMWLVLKRARTDYMYDFNLKRFNVFIVACVNDASRII